MKYSDKTDEHKKKYLRISEIYSFFSGGGLEGSIEALLRAVGVRLGHRPDRHAALTAGNRFVVAHGAGIREIISTPCTL